MSSNETVKVRVHATWSSEHEIECTPEQAQAIREASVVDRLGLVLDVEDIDSGGASLTDWDIDVPESEDVG